MPSSRIHALLKQERTLIFPGVYDSLGAKLVEQAGFPLTFISGYSVAATQLGLPDFGYLTQTEMVAVAWKHPTMFIEIGAIAPRYIARAGTGWEPLLVYGKSLLQDRVLWATDCMLPFARSLEEARELPLPPDVLDKWLGLNAARLLNLG